MPLQVVAPLYKTMELERSDERYGNDGVASTVTIRQASQAEHETRQAMFNKLERKFSELNPEEVVFVQDLPMETLKRLETYLTLVECNITDGDGIELFPSKKDKDGNPALAMSRSQFDKAWGSLPPDVAEEIHSKVLEVNIVWGGKRGEAS